VAGSEGAVAACLEQAALEIIEISFFEDSSMTALLQSLSHLGPHERLQLVEDLWDSIDEDSVPVMSDAIYQELQHRTIWANANPNTGQTLEQIAATLG
jgi:putative addiction module component (TIGR02574 family)